LAQDKQHLKAKIKSPNVCVENLRIKNFDANQPFDFSSISCSQNLRFKSAHIGYQNQAFKINDTSYKVSDLVTRKPVKGSLSIR